MTDETCAFCGERRSPDQFEDGLRCTICAEADDADPNNTSWFQDHVDRVNEQVRTVHERHACPRCGAPLGARCVRVGTPPAEVAFATPLKHSHRERVELEVPLR